MTSPKLYVRVSPHSLIKRTLLIHTALLVLVLVNQKYLEILQLKNRIYYTIYIYIYIYDDDQWFCIDYCKDYSYRHDHYVELLRNNKRGVTLDDK